MKTYLSPTIFRLGILLLISLSIASYTKAQIIRTIAGAGTAGYSGDGGPATASKLNSPIGVALDRSGNIYIADQCNSTIRKINASGVITTFAGTGTPGYSGDGGAATAAKLDTANGVAVDTFGNVYIADTRNNCIRKVNTSGIISTIAGTGTAGFSGDGGPASAAQFNYPMQLAISDSGYIYITDWNNGRVRKISPAGIITTFAGGGSFPGGDGYPATAPYLSSPYGILLDRIGNVYISEQDPATIRKVDTTGIISTIGGSSGGFGGDGGPATAARFSAVAGMAFDIAGNMYVADVGNCRIRRIDPSGIVTTFAGSASAGFSGDGGPATSAKLRFAYDVATDAAGNVFIADFLNNRVRKVTSCLPSVAAVTGAVSVCRGSMVTLYNTTTGGTWSSSAPAVATVNSAGIVTGLSTGNAIISYSVTNSCGTVSAAHLLTVGDVPNAGNISGATAVCPTDTIHLTDTIVSGYWFTSNPIIASVSTAGVVTGLTSGMVSIGYVVSNSCGSDTAVLSVTVRTFAACHTGIGSLPPSASHLEVYPNPSHGTFTIRLTDAGGNDAPVVITNILGQKVKELTIAANKDTEVKLNVPAGIYIISATIKDEPVNSKIIVQ